MKRIVKGFTLLEMLLVLAIASMIIYLSIGYMQQKTLQMRIDKTALQMQQILAASMAYYVANGQWPDSVKCLQGVNNACSANASGTKSTVQYLPANANVASPFGWLDSSGNSFGLIGAPNFTTPPFAGSPTLSVYTYIPMGTPAVSTAVATSIAGKLPLSYTNLYQGGNCTSTNPTLAKPCGPVGTVNIPGQNLNNAGAVTFSGIYKNGACVPKPACPVDANGNKMKAQIMVVPVSVSGTYDGPDNVYPISSFTAYAQGGDDATPQLCQPGGNVMIIATEPCYQTGSGTTFTSGQYWRVCLQVKSERGATYWGGRSPPYTDGSNSGYFASVLAITRCAIDNEPSGSSFDVFVP